MRATVRVKGEAVQQRDEPDEAKYIGASQLNSSIRQTLFRRESEGDWILDEGVSMKSVLVMALAGLVTLGIEAAPQDARESDRQQVTALITALDDTWNKHDMRAQAALFHEDGMWIAWTGGLLQGRARYEAELTRLHETVFKKSFHQGRIEELTFVAPDVAVVRGYGTVVGNEPTPEKVERYRNLIVVTKRDGLWKVSWGQKTRFADRTPDPDLGK
jgi:uncharacterized protein (TIGR02246 family)